MEVKRKDLLDILNKVKPGLATKEIVEEMTHFLFTGKDVITYNDRLCIHHPYETDFVGSVEASKMYEALTKIKSEGVVIQVVEAKGGDGLPSSIVTSSGKSKVSCSLVRNHAVFKQAKNLTNELAEIDDWIELPKKDDFQKGAYLCSFSASKDESSGTATCIRVEENIIWCGDQDRTSRYKLKTPMGSFMIKASIIPTIRDYSFTHYFVTKSWVHFIDEDNLTLSARKINGETLAYDRLFEKFQGTDIEFPDDLKNAIDISSIMSSGDTAAEKAISVTIEDNLITCEGRQDGGFSTSECEIQYVGDRIEFHINPVLLLEVLTRSSTISIGKYMAKFSDEEFSHLLAYKVE